MYWTVWSFLGVMVWTNGVDFGVGWGVGRTKGRELAVKPTRARNVVRQKLTVDVEKKKCHDLGPEI